MTLIEILVVIGVIGLLMALILPAVQNTRNIAVQMQCRNQLRQISLAMLNYESAYATFPVRSFQRQIRSYLEVPSDAEVVPLYACPSDRTHATGNMRNRHTSYAINAGLGADSDPRFFGFVRNQSGFETKAADLQDGMSNTAMIGECLSRPWYAPQLVAWDQMKQDWKRTYLYITRRPTGPRQFAEICQNESVRPVGRWLPTGRYHHLMVPNSVSCQFATPGGDLPPGDFHTGASAGSVHRGGTHVAFADGAVHFVNSEIDLGVWQAQGTRQGHEAF